MREPRGYETTPDSQAYRCSLCAAITATKKLGCSLVCSGCGERLQKRGYPGKPSTHASGRQTTMP